MVGRTPHSVGSIGPLTQRKQQRQHIVSSGRSVQYSVLAECSHTFTALDLPGHAIFNTSICQVGGRFVMMCEIDAHLAEAVYQGTQEQFLRGWFPSRRWPAAAIAHACLLSPPSCPIRAWRSARVSFRYTRPRICRVPMPVVYQRGQWRYLEVRRGRLPSSEDSLRDIN
jgi:hypothetical protein